MKNNILKIVGVVLVILGIGICFGVSIFFNHEVDVRIERAGVCNPLKSSEEKEVKISDKEKEQIRDYWKDTDKDKKPNDDEMVDGIMGDYKLFIGDDEILFNLDLGYVFYDDKNVDITDEFMEYISELVRKNDTELEKSEKPDKGNGSSECCSCCPDLKPGESCIAACCECP